MTNNQLMSIIAGLPELPSMPPVIAGALKVIEDPKSNINKLSSIISKDISLTTQILKIVNSAYYGFPSQITTINKAMALLGFKQIKSLILSVALKPMMMSQSGKQLWEHSLSCAVGCQIVSNSIGLGESDEAFVMGLLHDIGKNVIEIYNKSVANDIYKRAKGTRQRIQLEKKMLGFTHTEAGEILARKWKLPPVIVSCVRHHHSPLQSEHKSMVGIVHVVDWVLQDNFDCYDIDPNISNYLDFEVSDPFEFRQEIIETTEPIIRALR